MNLLVLGGTRFVGRAVVEVALESGDEVTVVSRGDSGEPPAGVEWIRGDRFDSATVDTVAARGWDAVIDTWSGDPAAVASSAAALGGRAGWYGYVSSRSVYRWPVVAGADETAAVIEAGEETGYAADKRGAELAVLQHFEGRCLLARAGLVIGPYEDTGRLTWWLSRAAEGGSVIAPGPRDRPWQYVDARDLADFMLRCARSGIAGTYNVVGERGAGVTTQRLLEACLEVTGNRTPLTWVEPDLLRRAKIGEWDDLPGWTSPDGELAGLHDCDVSAAVAAGLSCRSVEDTVGDTWQWLREIPPYRRPPVRPGLPRRGLTAEQEQAVWWLLPRFALRST
jgi:nucleoside-diphosphate-sugar epimerase